MCLCEDVHASIVLKTHCGLPHNTRYVKLPSNIELSEYRVITHTAWQSWPDGIGNSGSVDSQQYKMALHRIPEYFFIKCSS